MPEPRRIQPLPPELISQIAAGEVVERPASVVKELIENALDAGARRIHIRVRGAGRQLIEVADDGHGIPADQLPLAVARHATSKIRSAEDLFRIMSLGFRGEALAAIGSVSRLTLTSRPPDAAMAARIRVEGGRQVGPVEPVPGPVGTVVRVEDLFYNVPARRKFLKKPATERRAIDAMVMRYALAYPDVRFRLEHDGRLTLHTPGRGERRDVLAALYGSEIARQMIPVLSEDPDLGLTIQGFISPPGLTRSHRRDMLFFVNGRPVYDAALAAAVLQGYQNALMKGRYPISVLFITLPPEAVDVNVHPTKAEVRFRDPDAVFRAVVRAVRKALMAHAPLAADGSTLTQWDVIRPRWATPAQAAGAPRADVPPPEPPALEPLPELHDATETDASVPQDALAPAAEPSPAEPLLRLVGQVAATYLVAEGPDGLYLIDQHAAHERVLFERLRAQWLSRQPASQRLLEPVTLVLPPHQARALEAQLDTLRALGYDIEPFGLNMFRVRAVPALFASQDPTRAVQVAVEDIDEDETPLAHAREERLIARICKGLAVKAGQRLSPEEQARLLQDLLACENPRTCPHGRPTMIHIPVQALERQFGRLGPR